MPKRQSEINPNQIDIFSEATALHVAPEPEEMLHHPDEIAPVTFGDLGSYVSLSERNKSLLDVHTALGKHSRNVGLQNSRYHSVTSRAANSRYGDNVGHVVESAEAKLPAYENEAKQALKKAAGTTALRGTDLIYGMEHGDKVVDEIEKDLWRDFSKQFANSHKAGARNKHKRHLKNQSKKIEKSITTTSEVSDAHAA